MINSNHEGVLQFEAEWTDLAKRICQATYVHPDIQKLKTSLIQNGFLSLEEKSAFIDIVDKVKYDLIYQKYGPEGSEGYKSFSESWMRWFQEKGVSSSQERGQRNSVDHILFGSTPDPVQFLMHFEHEMLGSMEKPAEAEI